MKSSLRIALCAAGLLAGCTSGPPRGIVVTEIAPGGWSAAAPAEVFYENPDTLGQRTMDLLVRFRNDFSCGRLDVVLETLTPDSLVWCDTLSVPFGAAQTVETASLTYTDVRIPYRSRSRLNRTGTYRFRFTPAAPGPCNGEVIGAGIEITPQ